MASTVLSLALIICIGLPSMCYNHSYQFTHHCKICQALSPLCLCLCGRSFPNISAYQSPSQPSGATNRYCLHAMPLLLLWKPSWFCSPHSHKSSLVPLSVALTLVFQQIFLELLIYSTFATRCWFHAAV